MSFERMDSATYLAALLARGFARALAERAEAIGFLPGQFPVLTELWNEDGLTQRQLLDRLDIEQATLANTLARMERDGLITRQRHPTDRRAICNFLTDRARDMREPAMAAARAADDALFSGFRRFERELMLEYMRVAIENSRKSEPEHR